MMTFAGTRKRKGICNRVPEPKVHQTVPGRSFSTHVHKLYLLMLLLIPTAVFADSIIYTYAGKPFTTVRGNVMTGDFLSVTITLSTPLLPSQSDEVVMPLSWSISDGVAADTLTSTNHTYLFEGFEFRTDASGNITGWAVGANDGPNSGFSWTANNWKLFGGVTTLDEYYEGTNVSINQNQPGAWSSATAAIPEPSTALLLGLPTVLLAVRCFKRIRRKTHLPS